MFKANKILSRRLSVLFSAIFLFPCFSFCATENERKNGLVHLRRAERHYRRNDYPAALKDIKRALFEDANLWRAHFLRGMALGRLGRLPESIAALSRCLRLRPNSSLTYTKRGVRYLWRGKEEKARLDFQKALELDPRNSEAHDDLGVIYARRRDFIRAERSFLLALRHDPTYYKAYHNLALIYFIVGQNRAALQAIRRANELKPARNSLLIQGKILETLGRRAEAKRARERAARLPPDHWSESMPLK